MVWCIILYVLMSMPLSTSATDVTVFVLNYICVWWHFLFSSVSLFAFSLIKCLHWNLGWRLPRFNIFMCRLRWVALFSQQLCLFFVCEFSLWLLLVRMELWIYQEQQKTNHKRIVTHWIDDFIIPWWKMETLWHPDSFQIQCLVF